MPSCFTPEAVLLDNTQSARLPTSVSINWGAKVCFNNITSTTAVPLFEVDMNQFDTANVGFGVSGAAASSATPNILAEQVTSLGSQANGGTLSHSEVSNNAPTWSVAPVTTSFAPTTGANNLIYGVARSTNTNGGTAISGCVTERVTTGRVRTIKRLQ